jgi:protein ImuB
VERLLVVRCVDLLAQHEHGREARAFAAMTQTLAAFATRVDPVRPGVCAVPTRGPSRYFGGDLVLAHKADTAVTREITGVTVTVGVADGLFAAFLAAVAAAPGEPVVVAPGEAPSFLAPWSLSALARPELADLLVRLGIRTLGDFAALPTAEVLARFGADGAVCRRVAGGTEGELPGFRLFFPRPGPGRPGHGLPGHGLPEPGLPGSGTGRTRPAGGPRQGGFWGDTADGDARAARAAVDVQAILGPESVVRARLQGGRGPGQRFRLVPWTGVGEPGTGPDRAAVEEGGTAGAPGHGDPWPGQIPPPAPAVVLDRPLPAQLTDTAGDAVGVTGDGAVTAAPARLSVAGGRWADVDRWAGPWPSDERWWSIPSRRRQARIQVVTAAGGAYLLTRERGTWWLEATYD